MSGSLKMTSPLIRNQQETIKATAGAEEENQTSKTKSKSPTLQSMRKSSSKLRKTIKPKNQTRETRIKGHRLQSLGTKSKKGSKKWFIDLNLQQRMRGNDGGVHFNSIKYY